MRKVKDSYWLNCYLPIGNFKNMYLLPVVYFILIMCTIWGIGLGRIDVNGIIMALMALYFIIYDFIYKIKKRKSVDGEVDDRKLIKSYKTFINIIRIIPVVIICIILALLFFRTKDIISRLIMLPFILCVICLFWQVVARIIGNNMLVKIFSKMYVFIFLIYWFGIIGVGLYSAIINNEYNMIVFMMPFVIAGIFVGYKYLGKKK